MSVSEWPFLSFSKYSRYNNQWCLLVPRRTVGIAYQSQVEYRLNNTNVSVRFSRSRLQVVVADVLLIRQYNSSYSPAPDKECSAHVSRALPRYKPCTTSAEYRSCFCVEDGPLRYCRIPPFWPTLAADWPRSSLQVRINWQLESERDASESLLQSR